MSRLQVKRMSVGYEHDPILKTLNIDIPDGSFTAIIGPNGCGKTTLLRSLCRLLKPETGQVCLDGENIHHYPAKTVAKQLGLLPQSANAPEGIRVTDLVARGRYPHQTLFRQWSEEDAVAVQLAMDVTGTTQFADRMVDSLSGGQRQRVWIAMALAQQTPILLLDEPTTYLDIAHQIDLMELFRMLNLESGRTLVAVLHDLNHACRYATHLIAIKDGEVVAQGSPQRIITAQLVQQVFGLDCIVINDPVSHTPLIIPKGSFTHSHKPALERSSTNSGPTFSNDSGETMSS
ncbi:ABC transporter ATP-binding protein [Ketobacter sp. MCCC 1A13808]|uniref:ABC transporter ATP-binding protein n=1 Tax=Ketobacter sp. MCCC 1A13808 TaxID=2602738 RepID=UPI0012EC3995|nr:ABC transporter ATP-binding protein [Ketobacter sp. MCCC 1A13808]MVF11560.1 ABC transporter ATP-binding protein [Ketobacter sp. MCCC 1A13808]